MRYSASAPPVVAGGRVVAEDAVGYGHGEERGGWGHHQAGAGVFIEHGLDLAGHAPQSAALQPAYTSYTGWVSTWLTTCGVNTVNRTGRIAPS